MPINPETLQKLARYDTPTICNAVELFDVRSPTAGFMDGRIRSVFPELPPMVGFACTAAFRSCAPPCGADAYASVLEQVEAFAELPGPAVVVFQDLDDPPVGATFGEVMCSVYRAFGSAGLVTSGGGRDLPQVRALGYPVFTGSAICAHACCHILHLGSTIRVGGLVVHQGDLLHGDANGVATIPLEIAADVPDVAAEVVEAEKIMPDYLHGSGPKTVPQLREVHRQTVAALDAIRRRLTGRP